MTPVLSPDAAVRPMPPRSAWPAVPSLPEHRPTAEPPAPAPASWPLAVCRAVVAGVLMTLAGLVLIAVSPRGAGWEGHVVVSGSMAPRLAPGDIVLTRPVLPQELQPGQVLLFPDPDSPERLLLHRLVSFDENGALVTRGDANQSNDSVPVPVASVIGQAELRIPYVGLPTYWRLQGSWGHIALVAGVLAAATVFVSCSGGSARAGGDRPPAPAAPTGPAGRHAHRREGRPTGHRAGSRAGRRRGWRATTTGDRELRLAGGRA
ncbi:signal peptidase I [Modestobacter sp. URMC 112]